MDHTILELDFGLLLCSGWAENDWKNSISFFVFWGKNWPDLQKEDKNKNKTLVKRFGDLRRFWWVEVRIHLPILFPLFSTKEIHFDFHRKGKILYRKIKTFSVSTYQASIKRVPQNCSRSETFHCVDINSHPW